MTTQVEKKHRQSNASKYVAVIILALLPLVLAMTTNGTDISEIPPTLISGVYPAAFALLSWGIAAKLIHDIRK